MKYNFFSKINLFCLIFITVIFFFDRISKIEILKVFQNTDSIFVNDFLNLSLVFNTGIGFGLLSLEAGLLYNIISFFIFFVILILIHLLLKSKSFEKYCFSAVIGGALGNLYDRIFFKAVPDFIDFHIGSFHWFSFNIADIFISIGIILILLKEFNSKNKKNEI